MLPARACSELILYERPVITANINRHCRVFTKCIMYEVEVPRRPNLQLIKHIHTVMSMLVDEGFAQK